MQSFKQYLIEVKRTVDRAIKLGEYISKKQKLKYKPTLTDKLFKRKTDDLIYFKNYNPLHRIKAEHLYSQLKHKNFSEKEISKIPINNLIPTQDATHFNKEKAISKFNDKTPIKILKHKNNHYIIDGHHRILAHHLQGETHINAQIKEIS